MLTYYIDKKSTVNIEAQINIKADILQFLNGRKKNNQLFLVKMYELILVAQNSVKCGLKLLFIIFNTENVFITLTGMTRIWLNITAFLS